MSWLCENCDQKIDSARPDPQTGGWRCPACGSIAQLASTEVAPPTAGSPEAASFVPPEEGPSDTEQSSADTVFQPVLMLASIMDELDSEQTLPGAATTSELGTETLETDPNGLSPPILRLDVEAYFMILGADPGNERRPLVRAKTTFGRRGADVALDDPAISARHFQIEAFGREFFLRDLDSRNGTFLNGTKVRYSQLVPGDQVTAGKTSLIFRTSDDLIDRR